MEQSLTSGTSGAGNKRLGISMVGGIFMVKDPKRIGAGHVTITGNDHNFLKILKKALDQSTRDNLEEEEAIELHKEREGSLLEDETVSTYRIVVEKVREETL